MEEFTNVTEAINYLHGLPRLHRRNDLSYIKKVLAQFDNPQNAIETIHVTGTNGKGSTSYYLANLLQKAGFKTGLFVSPFIISFNERIQIDGQNITDQALIKLVEKVKKQVTKIAIKEPEFILTEFEFLVVMAFIYFKEQQVGYAVIEAGIGARHDKTNVIIPKLSIITSVGLDHEELIGPTIEDIAREKSGVIKPNSPVILGDISQSAKKVILAEAKKNQASTFELNRDFKIINHSMSEKNSFQIQLFDGQIFEFMIRPEVEQKDVAMAVQAFFLLGQTLTIPDVVEVIDQLIIPGRYQVVQKSPTIIADGAHNIQAMQNLIDYVEQAKDRQGKVYYLVAIMKDKDLFDIINLLPKANLVLTTIDYARAAKADDFKKIGFDDLNYQADFRAAFQDITKRATKHDMIVVTGSFYFVAEFLNYYKTLR